jgi:NhaA family Na+:H+ antiporter
MAEADLNPPSQIDAGRDVEAGSSRARRIARRVLAPIEGFLAIEAASGIVLLVAALIALIWANSSHYATYEQLWHTPVGLRFGAWAFERDLHFVINDGLMTLFFFVVGLEIRREMHTGELSEVRRASLPVVAAFGGMLVPALIFVALNHGRSSAGGWGVPVATDIAFAVGVLALLGKRVAPALRVLLLALAVIDDIGAIMVIALFYSSGLSAAGLPAIIVGLLAIRAMKVFGARSPFAYVAPALLIWAGTYMTGIHPTLAGVVIGLLTPVHASPVPGSGGRADAASPVERLQHGLHGWVAFGIMPLFALANAGVKLGGGSSSASGRLAFLGVVLGLVVGKPAGIVGVSWIAVRCGIARLPAGIGFRHVAVAGAVAGIGFTMAIFIAQLAFASPELLETAKLAVLCASATAALIGLGLGYMVLPRAVVQGAARSEEEAERSSEL